MARGRRPLGKTDKGGDYAGGSVQQMRGALRTKFKKKLVALTGDKSAMMWWNPARYHQWIFLRRKLCLVGWPEDILFCNLSRVPGGRESLRRLCEAWDNGTMHFRAVVPQEISAHVCDIAGVAPGKFDDLGRHHPGRCDNKKTRYDKKTGKPVSSTRKLRLRGAITPKYVVDSDVDE